MSKRKPPRFPLRMPDDTVPFKNANAALEKLGVYYTRPSLHALKLGDINYYPSSGVLHIDGEPKARRQRGLKALTALLLERRAKHRVLVAKRKAEIAEREAITAELSEQASDR